jgi:hypothetical protein
MHNRTEDDTTQPNTHANRLFYCGFPAAKNVETSGYCWIAYSAQSPWTAGKFSDAFAWENNKCSCFYNASSLRISAFCIYLMRVHNAVECFCCVIAQVNRLLLVCRPNKTINLEPTHNIPCHFCAREPSRVHPVGMAAAHEMQISRCCAKSPSVMERTVEGGNFVLKFGD